MQWAHLKLDLLLTETGFRPTTNQRFRVYLTNSLEEYHQDTGTLFANWLSTEANEANHIKRDTPVMCVIGNPPYAVSSTNKNEWIQNLISDYKKDLNERKINLDDDYIKFIRYGQHYIDKNGSGILAYISNNSFIDGITHRQMRKNLLESFDKIYILDLHGSAKKKEVCVDGSADQNVFDIMQGVSINIFIKNGKKKKNELGEIYHSDLFGKREFKYEYLNENTLNSIKWNKLDYSAPNYFFVKKDFKGVETYEQGFKIDELFLLTSNGIEVGRESVGQTFSKNELINIGNDLENLTSNEFQTKYSLKDSRDWVLELFKKDLLSSEREMSLLQAKPFDYRHTFFTGTSRGFHTYPAITVNKHVFKKDNIVFITTNQAAKGFKHVFVSKTLSSRPILDNSGLFGTGRLFPLYLYPETNGQLKTDQSTERTPNLNKEIVKQIAEELDLIFTNEKENTENTFAPIDILDYIYAVLHSPTYREKYKEFLKIDFPRVPYPKDKNTFWQLVKLGGDIRQIHLLESPTVEKYITQYPIDGDNVVGKTKYQDGKVFINDTQYFDNVPKIAWEFYIGGYQPSQKWLKDRKERTLEFDDILHYQKIIVALAETDRIMHEINKIDFMGE
jgi:predicted helicase